MQAWGKQTWKQDSCCILGLPSHPVGWSHSPKGHTVSTLIQRHFGRYGGGGLNIAHEVAPDKGPLKQQLYVQQAVGTTWNKLYTHKHTHTKREFAWLHWYHVFQAFSSAGLNAVWLLQTPVVSANVRAMVRCGRKLRSYFACQHETWVFPLSCSY